MTTIVIVAAIVYCYGFKLYLVLVGFTTYLIYQLLLMGR